MVNANYGRMVRPGKTTWLLLLCCLLELGSRAQDLPERCASKDVRDFLQFRKGSKEGKRQHDVKKNLIAVMPAAGYSLQTRFAVLASANALYHVDSESKLSLVNSNITYTQNQQVIFPILSDIWLQHNQYHINTDWRFLKFPSETFGLGIHSDINQGYTLDYSAIRLHQSLMRRVFGACYVGVGWDVDYFWDVQEIDTPSKNSFGSFTRYGGAGTEFSLGPVLASVWDNRDNPVDPRKGSLLKIDLHFHPLFLGNSANWTALVLDLRHYIRFPSYSKNVLAIWNYDWLTLGAKVPYLLLPTTGGDPNSNTGRGYIPGRFRGRNFYYLESEYRASLTRNGLLGLVVFGNLETVTQNVNSPMKILEPGYGAGLRIKLNKSSRTNLAIDYGFGAEGSQGLFVNLGEVF